MLSSEAEEKFKVEYSPNQYEHSEYVRSTGGLRKFLLKSEATHHKQEERGEKTQNSKIYNCLRIFTCGGDIKWIMMKG